MFGMSDLFGYLRSMVRTANVENVEPIPVTGIGIQDLRRIMSEYSSAAMSLEKQRDETWKKMFLEQWKGHYNAQVTMEKRLHEIQLTCAKVCQIWPRVGDGRVVMRSHVPRKDDSMNASSAYREAMLKIESDAAPDTDVGAAVSSISKCCTFAMSGDDSKSKRVALEIANGRLFDLISSIEKERNIWGERYMIQSGQHLERQASLEEEIGNASAEVATFIRIVNAALRASGKPEIRDMKSLDSTHESVYAIYRKGVDNDR